MGAHPSFQCVSTHCDVACCGKTVDIPRILYCHCDGLKCRWCRGDRGGRALPQPSMDDQELVRAAREGDQAALMEAIQNGANLETRNPVGFNASMRYNGVDDNIRLGMTPLMHAAQEGNSDCLRMLLLARASPHAEDEDGMCALHFAASAANLDCAGILLWAGAYASAVDRAGLSALGHLPADVHADESEIRRWIATLSFTPRDIDNDMKALAMVAEHVTKNLDSGCEHELQVPDSLDYTGLVLESMPFGQEVLQRQAAAKCSARSPEADLLPMHDSREILPA